MNRSLAGLFGDLCRAAIPSRLPRRFLSGGPQAPLYRRLVHDRALVRQYVHLIATMSYLHT